MKRYSDLNINIFKDYIFFFYKNNEFIESEKVLYVIVVYEFVRCIENICMIKSYKMFLFFVFYNNGELKFVVIFDDIYKSFIEFYFNFLNVVDLVRYKSIQGYKEWIKEDWLDFLRKNLEEVLLNDNEFLKFFKRDGEFLYFFKDFELFIKN